MNRLEQELDMTLKEISRKKPPVAPKKPNRDPDQSDSNSDQESKPKMSSIMSKVSKFEYYAKQQRCVGRSQFYTTNEVEISPKVFSANSLTVNTPAKDVLGGKTVPNYMKNKDQKVITLNENNSIDPRNCSYANVTVRNKTRVDDIVRNLDDSYKLPKKVNNDEQDNVYGKINKDNIAVDSSRSEQNEKSQYGRIGKGLGLPSPAFDRNPQYAPVYVNHYDRSHEAESRRMKVCKACTNLFYFILFKLLFYYLLFYFILIIKKT